MRLDGSASTRHFHPAHNAKITRGLVSNAFSALNAQLNSFAQLRIRGASWLWSHSRTGTSQVVGSGGGRHIHVEEVVCLWPAAV